ncbi:hypothetical protein G9A89_004585 [Geosiphon pyriformis]|nr:hypothetical protein G9A89_004585 [Geosiphon pyriformis]
MSIGKMIEIGLNLLVTCSRKVHKLNFEIITEAEIREKCKKKLPNSFMLYRLENGHFKAGSINVEAISSRNKRSFSETLSKVKEELAKTNPQSTQETSTASYEVSRSTPLLTNHPVTTETEPLWSIRSPETVAFYEFTAGTDYVADNVAN